jgi:hypothetical protein
MIKHNFLLGRGERLTEDISVRSGGGPKYPPYSFAEARSRLEPMLTKAISRLDELPAAACPDDQAVATLTLNPEYIAKSYYPHELFKAVGVEPVGSREKRITPEKRSRDRLPEETVTTEFFVMGPRSAFRRWNDVLPRWTDRSIGAKDLVTIEAVSVPTISEKIKGPVPDSKEAVLEVVLHTDELLGESRLLPLFQKYLEQLGIGASFDRRFYAGGLCFLELAAPTELIAQIAEFTPIRALRQMPRLRMLRPTIRSASVPAQSLVLPADTPVDPSIRVAIFDGGIPDDHPITTWATPIDAPGVGAACPDFLDHGVGVTSAFLFGHIDPTKEVSRPFSFVDHYRVLDTAPGQNPYELYEVLDRIQTVLENTHYDFINLSLGPKLPIEDDDVHAWTAVLDDWLSRADTLATVAVGNDGEGDAELGLNRIQVPADCVNALAIGACDSPDPSWQRAAYSSVGPGRSPGLIKPDLVEFGGAVQRPFLVLGPGSSPALQPTGGTSFAAPSTLRLGAGIRAHFGSNLSMLAIRSLLIHCTEGSDWPRHEVGWGRLARDIDDIVLCDDDTVRVVYQGSISASKYIRASVPVPSGEIPGKVSIKATLCYSTAIDPHHPSNYTRSGLEVVFRPHSDRRKDPKQVHPNSKGFFGPATKGLTEEELRRDAWKWENCQHATLSMNGSSLQNPTFDIHYNARLEGHGHTPSRKLRYALVISVQAKRVSDLYDQVVRKYASQLEQLRPVVEIPIRT